MRNFGSWCQSVAFGSALIVATSLAGVDLANAGNGPLIRASGQTVSGKGAVRSAAEMSSFVGQPSRGPAGPINRPTMPLASYNAAKDAASFGVGQKAQAQAPAGPVAPAFTTNFTGAVEGENGEDFVPPDVDAAVGVAQILQPSNSSIDVYSKGGAHLRSSNQNGFVGNFTDSLGDGRAVYDPNYARWVVLIDDFSNLTGSGSPQYYVAVSQTSDATGSYFVFPAFVNLTAGEFFDFPQLGMDQDALLITANMFNNSTGAFIGPIAFAIPKARVYNGAGFSVPVFSIPSSTVGGGTIAPPYVEDASGLDYFVAAPLGSGVTAIKKFTMSEAGRLQVAFAGPVNITVNSYTDPPPNAKQTCTGTDTTRLIDSSDGRFQNRSYQVGSSLWQIHTITIGGFPAPDFYQIGTGTNTIVQQAVFFLSSTSFDFNPHIVANFSNSAIVTWTATDPPNGKDALVMFSGRTSATALNTMPPGVAVAGSTSCLIDNFDPNFGHQRWGDYSAANLDPAAAGVFWVTNEKITGSSASFTDRWATHHARVTP